MTAGGGPPTETGIQLRTGQASSQSRRHHHHRTQHVKTDQNPPFQNLPPHKAQRQIVRGSQGSRFRTGLRRFRSLEIFTKRVC